MHTELAPRTLANGKTYCIEESDSNTQYDRCAADLEEYAWKSEQDKARALRYFDNVIDNVLSPQPGWWRRMWQRVDRPKNSATP